MYKHFNPIIKVSHSYALNENHGIYLSFKKNQLSEVQDLLTFAYETSEGQLHTDFIKSYALNMKEHIECIERNKFSLETASQKLIQLLNNFEGLKQGLASEGFDYFLNIDVDTLYFFKPIGYDSYLRSEGYMILELLKGKKGYKANQLSIGFTTKSVDELSNEPSFIRKQIDKFSKLNTLEEVNSHAEYCEELLVEFYHVKEYGDFFLPESISPMGSISKEILGNPLDFIREIYKVSTAQIIKISLPQELREKLNDEIIELIKNEGNINKKDTYKDLMKEEHFKSFCKDLFDRKTKLMNNLSINQTELDEYMGYLPETFMD